jgi:hypothetical protein
MGLLQRILLLTGATTLIYVATNAQQNVWIDLTRNPKIPAPNTRPQLIAPDYATQCYGFFCRQELKGDKALPVPLRVRLGSMQQNDWLEGKPNAVAPAR